MSDEPTPAFKIWQIPAGVSAPAETLLAICQAIDQHKEIVTIPANTLMFKHIGMRIESLGDLLADVPWTYRQSSPPRTWSGSYSVTAYCDEEGAYKPHYPINHLYNGLARHLFNSRQCIRGPVYLMAEFVSGDPTDSDQSEADDLEREMDMPFARLAEVLPPAPPTR